MPKSIKCTRCPTWYTPSRGANPRYCPNCVPPRGGPSSGHPEPPDALDHAFTAYWDARYGSYVPEPPGPYRRSTICDI